MAGTKQQRSFSTGVEISLGMLTAVVDVAPIKRQGYSKVGEVRYACGHPDHAKPVGVVQRYLCLGEGDGDGTYHESAEHELRRMKVVDDETALYLSTEELNAARVGVFPKDALAINVHLSDEVEQATIATDTSYRVRLGKKASGRQRELYGILCALAADTDLALVGSLRLRDSRRVYRLALHRGQLTLVGLLLPAELEPTDDIEIPEIDTKLLTMAQTLVETMVEPFAEGKAYEWDVEAAFAELVATKGTEPAPIEKVKESDDDIVAAMEKMLANARLTTPSRKPRARKTPVKKSAATKRAATSKEN